MRSRAIAGLFALCVLASSAQALQESSAFSIQYPLPNFRIGTDPPDKAGRASDVQRLATHLESSLGVELARTSDRMGRTSIVTDLRLGRAIPPIRVLWNDPRYLFRTPVVLEWIELIDERGRVSRAWVTASNQSPQDDARIIGWCANAALRQSGEVEGRGTAALRTAGVTLVGSSYHYTSWIAKLRTKGGMVVALVATALVAWLIGRVVSFKHEQRMRHERLMARLHRTTPFKPPSIDDKT